MTLADEFENKLESGGLPRPIPRWLVVAKRAALWAGLCAVVVSGSVALGICLWLVSDPALRGRVPFFAVLDALPLTWLAASFLTAVVAVVIYRFTPHGYRHRLPFVILAVFALSLAAGVGLVATSIPERAEETVSRALPPYHDMAGRRMMRFAAPERGVVVGRVVSDREDGTFDLRDPMLRVWRVESGSIAESERVGAVAPGSCLWVFGEVTTGTSGFVAKSFRPCPRGLRLPPPPPSR